MIRGILFIFWFWVYVIFSGFKRIKYNYYKKYKGEEKAAEYLFKIVAKWGKNCVKYSGSKVKVIGLDNLPEGNCLFVGNHQGLFDIPLILSEINKPMGFIAKIEMIKAPILAGWMKKMHCVFMDRSDIRASVKSINEGVDNLQNGYSMVIFPEGTRSKSTEIAEFKKGSMKMGLKADVPIVPLTVNGTFNILEETGFVRPAEVTLVISKPIYAKDLSKEEQGNLAETIKNIISNNIKTLN